MTGTELPLGLVALVAGLAIAPFFLVLVTSFAKIAVVLSLLRHAIGAPEVPSNRIVTGLAIVLSIFVMAPVGEAIWTEVEPWVARAESEAKDWSVDTYLEIAGTAVEPLRAFLTKHADPAEVDHMLELAAELRPIESRDDVRRTDLPVVMAAFVTTELTEAFLIGFLLFIPFLVIDLVIANVLLTLGIGGLSPTTVSLPFKLLLFVLIDGWYLVVRGLLLGYA